VRSARDPQSYHLSPRLDPRPPEDSAGCWQAISRAAARVASSQDSKDRHAVPIEPGLRSLSPDCLAGAGGFEPPYGGIKIRCQHTKMPRSSRGDAAVHTGHDCPPGRGLRLGAERPSLHRYDRRIFCGQFWPLDMNVEAIDRLMMGQRIGLSKASSKAGEYPMMTVVRLQGLRSSRPRRPPVFEGRYQARSELAAFRRE
jgi:hypothetical protein